MKKILALILGVVIGITVFFGVSNFALDQPVFQEKQDMAEEVIAELQDKTCYYYNGLNDEQKTAYRVLYRSLMNFNDTADVVTTENDLNSIWKAVLYDNAEIFWVANDFEYIIYDKKLEIHPKYTMSKEETDKIKVQLESKISEILLNANALPTDYDKELYFHDYIALNCVYDKSTLGNTGDTAYSVILNGKSICEGYARAFQTFLDRIGLRNYVVVGNGTSDGKTEPHMWNIVELNGKNYQVDVTWDDFDNDDGVGHLYFNTTDTDILREHSELQPAENNCVSFDESYFSKNGTYIEKFDGYNALVEPCAKMISNDRYYVEIRFASDVDYKKALSILENDNEFFNFVGKVAKRSNGKIKSDEVSYVNQDEFNYIGITFIKK